MVWNIDPIAFESGGIVVRWYGVFLSTAFVVAFFHTGWLMRLGDRADQFDRVVLAGFLGGIIGARLGHFLFYEPIQLRDSPLVVLDPGTGGLASHGAALGALVGLAASAWRNDRLPLVWLLARCSLSFALICAIVRIGNFFNGEILGTPTDLPWAVNFPRVDDIYRHPVQLYESLACVVCYGFLLTLLRHTRNDALVFGAALVGVSATRMVTELFKAPQSALEVNLDMTLGFYLTIPWLLFGMGVLGYSLVRGPARDR